MQRLRTYMKKAALSATALLLLPAATMLLGSCDNGCEQTRENYMHVAFTSTSGRTLNRLTMIMKSGGVETESSNYTSFTDIEVDVNPSDSVTTLCLESTYTDYGDRFTVADTIELHYTVTPKFLDLSCGCSVIYNITQVQCSRHLLSNTVINNAEVLPDGGVNITFEY